MANDEHYAILIGISRYQESLPVAKIEGPAEDVAAVRRWLVDPAGGGVPDDDDHVCTIVSANYEWPPPAPSKQQLDAAFDWLIAKEGKGSKGWKVGQRLYLYMSGHGFSSQFKACLMTGGATDRFTDHISPSAWIEWLQDAGYFRECVLWMDACMERVALVPPNPAPANPFPGNRYAPGPAFIAMSAPRPLLAAEKQLPAPPAPWRGVFTYNLVEGLRGAAADQFGRVTGRSLGDWLRRSQLTWLDDKDRANPSLAKMPAVLQEDQALVFARGLTPPDYAVTLAFPQAFVGERVRLWSEQSATPGAWREVPVERTIGLSLRPGLYLVESEGGLRHGFAVTRPTTVAVAERGPAPRPDDGRGPFRIAISPEGSDPEIRLFGARWQLVDTDIGALSSRLPFGLYEMRIQSGRQIVEKVILLDDDWPAHGGDVPEMPEMTTAAPLPATRADHDYQRATVRDGTPDVGHGAGAELFVMARRYSGEIAVPGGPSPWQGIEIWDAAGELVADLSRDGVRNEEAGRDPWATCLIRLDPGHYRLHYRTDAGETLAQALILPPNGWRLDCHLLRATIGGAGDSRPRMSLTMRRPGVPLPDADALLAERLNVALADERAVAGDWLVEALAGDLANPLLGIVGGHLLLIGRDSRPEFGPRLLEQLVAKLRELLGPGHPDVEALALQCGGEVAPPAGPIAAPPLYERSWRLLVAASGGRPNLISTALLGEVQATTGTAPFFSWSRSAAARRAATEALVARLGLDTEEAMASAAAFAPPPPAADPAMAGDAPETGFLAPPVPDRARAVAAALAMGLPAAAVDLAASFALRHALRRVARLAAERGATDEEPGGRVL